MAQSGASGSHDVLLSFGYRCITRRTIAGWGMTAFRRSGSGRDVACACSAAIARASQSQLASAVRRRRANAIPAGPIPINRTVAGSGTVISVMIALVPRAAGAKVPTDVNAAVNCGLAKPISAPPVRSAAKRGPALDPNALKQVWPKFGARFSDATTLPSEFSVLVKKFVTVKLDVIIAGSMNVELPPRGPSTVYRKIGHRSDRDSE